MNFLQRFHDNAKWIAMMCVGSTLALDCSSGEPVTKNISALGTNGRNYRYVYAMTDPIESTELAYRDERIQVRFQIDRGAIRYSLKNLSAENAVVLTERASIRVNNTSSLIRNERTYYSQNAESFLPVPIPPKGVVHDFVLPRDNISFDGSKWVEQDLFQRADNNDPAERKNILKSIGVIFDLVFPVQFGADQADYKFSFKIVRIRSVIADTIRAVEARFPVTPVAGWSSPGSEMWLTIGIVAGLAIVIVVALSQPKQAPSDF
jgi:hypothetical protein